MGLFDGLPAGTVRSLPCAKVCALPENDSVGHRPNGGNLNVRGKEAMAQPRPIDRPITRRTGGRTVEILKKAAAFFAKETTR